MVTETLKAVLREVKCFVKDPGDVHWRGIQSRSRAGPAGNQC